MKILGVITKRSTIVVFAILWGCLTGACAREPGSMAEFVSKVKSSIRSGDEATLAELFHKDLLHVNGYATRAEVPAEKSTPERRQSLAKNLIKLAEGKSWTLNVRSDDSKSLASYESLAKDIGASLPSPGTRFAELELKTEPTQTDVAMRVEIIAIKTIEGWKIYDVFDFF